MKCQILFSRKNKENISKCHLLKFLPSLQSVKSGIKTYILLYVTTKWLFWVLFKSALQSASDR